MNNAFLLSAAAQQRVLDQSSTLNALPIRI